MSIAMMQMLIERGLGVKIGQMILFYPVTVTNTHSARESYKAFEDGSFSPAETMDWMINTCIPDERDQETPLASPLYYLSDDVLAKFPPPTIILTAVDTLFDEGIAFGHRLQNVGVDIAIIKAKWQIHAFVLMKLMRQSAAAHAMIQLAASRMRQGLLLKQSL
jgi:acetyl esterase/lipase